MDEEEIRGIRKFYAEMMILSLCDLYGIGKKKGKVKIGRYGKNKQWFCHQNRMRRDAREFFSKRNKMFIIACTALDVRQEAMINLAFKGNEKKVRLVIKKLREVAK